MSTKTTNWTKDEFKAYLFIYCMHADAIDKEVEKECIINKVGADTFNKIYDEYRQDKDFVCINKIQDAYQSIDFSETEVTQLKADIHEVFAVDGKFDMIERGVESTLKRILK